MNHSIQTIIVILLTTACALPGCSRSSTAERDVPTISSMPTSDQDTTEHSADPSKDVATTNSDEPRDSFDYGLLSEADLARTSWENPFRPQLWSCDGWRIDENSMTSETETLHPATFLRPYRNVVIECRFSRSDEVASLEESVPIEFELRLLNRDTQRQAILSHTSGKVTLKESGGEVSSAQRPLRESTMAFNRDSQDVEVRLTMTPNRILVVIDGRMRINSPRPTSILNAECVLQFVAHEPGITISEVRLEGD